MGVVAERKNHPGCADVRVERDAASSHGLEHVFNDVQFIPYRLLRHEAEAMVLELRRRAV
jgi:hypothetical protein